MQSIREVLFLLLPWGSHEAQRFAGRMLERRSWISKGCGR